jgi:hypothetical protein
MTSCFTPLTSEGAALAGFVMIVGMIGGILLMFARDLSEYSWKLEKDSEYEWLGYLQLATYLVGAMMLGSLLVVLTFSGLNILEKFTLGAVGFVFGALLGHGAWLAGRSKMFKLRAKWFDIFPDQTYHKDDKPFFTQ